MNRISLVGASALALGAAIAPAAAQSIDPALQDVIVVTGARPATVLVENPDARPYEGPDATTLLSRVPGGARVGNGALSGQAQYRGLFGPRLNLRIDDQRFATSGPNLMDPPLHYAPLPLIAALEIDRGVSPVSEGPGLGGGMNAVFKRVDFGAGGDLTLGYDLSAYARSVDESYGFGGVIGAANDALRFNLLGAYEQGEDTAFPGGTIAASAFERGVYGASAGARLGRHTLSLDVRRQNTGPSGNPPFPMDIRYFDADFSRAGYEARYGGVRVEASASFADIAHAMNNYDLRPAPAPMDQRESFADATTRALEAAVTFPAFGGALSFGGDHEQVDRNVTITNPNNAAFVIGSLPDIEIVRMGVFAEWSGELGPLNGELGVRIDNTEASSGLAWAGAAVPMGPMMLAAAFNAADRSREDATVDAAARFWTDPRDGLSWRFTLARKTRAPSYLERFAWLPTNASGGLADGNIYVGDLDLSPEAALIAEAGFDYANERAYLRPTVYIREIDDYIQGVPFDATPGVVDATEEMVAAMNGDPTPLRFANVDARLYGVDLDAGFRFTENWRVDAVASLVRSERRDIDDNLYRIAPPSLAVGLTYEAPAWSVTFEGRFVGDQKHVSDANSEAPTDGYAVFSLLADWMVRDGVRISGGVENLFDETYEDHLGGYNRVAGGDVAVGQRLPGAGVGAFVRLSVER
jgi:iron complex outermembrane recepter protein